MPPTPALRETRIATGALVGWAVLALAQIGLGFAGAQGNTSQPNDPLFTWEFAIGTAIAYAVLVGLTLLIVGAYPLGIRETLGLHRFSPRWLAAGLGVIALAFVVGAIMNVFTDAANDQGLTPERWHAARAGAFAASAAVVVLFGPLAEEFFFRGLGVRVLAFAGQAAAVVVTALAFGLAHGIPAALPTLVVFGAGLAWIRYRSDSVWPGYATHAVWNGIALAVAAASF